MRKRRVGEPAPPPAKRGQRRKYEQEIDEKTGLPLSMETRARRGRELNHLKEENEALKKERTEFLAKIDALSNQLDTYTRNAPAEVLAEHQVLQREIALHTEFVAAFQAVLDEEATAEEKAKSDLYAQGAEAAQSFLLGLVSESVTWARAMPPPGVDIPLIDLEFRYIMGSDLFGKTEGQRRLSLRLDAFVPYPATAESVQTLFFRALCSAPDMQRLYGMSPTVNLVPIDKPNDNTHLLYFRRTASKPEERDQFTVFICHRSAQTMTKSALASPTAAQQDPIFGTAKAHIVSMTTSTMFPVNKDPVVNVVGDVPPNVDTQAVPVSGMIVKGVIAWDDTDFKGVRFIVIYSVPEDYKIINRLGFSDLVSQSSGMSASAGSSSEGESDAGSKKKKKKKSSSSILDEEEEHQMSVKFAHVLVAVANEFKSMMAERPGGSPKPMPLV